ncbi:rhomboid family intramembrane serine protease (plasmid) [Burkholderia sp. KK1]|uniref:Rhomboid family protein n=1 Tax=Burkholderia sp. M701 TaxID=326454 RepID=V5YNC7_9BURK|nr:rhomboid family intramembrane serine protease [Burkholderia sp. M701]AQH05859.1 rhomboid family intramembrane serine protease [Burkholderia sp. KK1]BAO19080.1 rhomboid family protein [Burkholderia sp. M701]
MSDDNTPSVPGFISRTLTGIRRRVSLLALFVGSVWVSWLAGAAFPTLHLAQYGVEPRTLRGLFGILFEPWLHANVWHLIANTGGLIILGWLCMWPTIGEFWKATVGGMIGAGLCAWLLGSPHSVHIGASGVVFGYAGYLIARGLYTRNILSALVALVVAGTYGFSLFLGLLPFTPGISWQSHLGGAIGGFLVARLAARP